MPLIIALSVKCLLLLPSQTITDQLRNALTGLSCFVFFVVVFFCFVFLFFLLFFCALSASELLYIYILERKQCQLAPSPGSIEIDRSQKSAWGRPRYRDIIWPPLDWYRVADSRFRASPNAINFEHPRRRNCHTVCTSRAAMN